jgi:FAD:protein FMN transferase
MRIGLMRNLVRVLGLCSVLACVAAPAAAQTRRAPRDAESTERVLLSAQQAVREIFPAAHGVAPHSWRPSGAVRESLSRQLGRELADAEYLFLLVYDESNRFLGYALETEERGKYRPITMMIGVTPSFAVQDAAVMTYRESRGSEVRQERFRRQYRGKTLDDPIRVNQDIINISGATISVQSMSAGVRKTLALAKAAFAAGAPSPNLTELRPLATPR